MVLKPAGSVIRAVLFDFDGTLVDSEYLHHESWLEAVAPWGVSVSWDEYVRQLVGISDRRASEFFLRRAGREVTPEATREGQSLKHRAYRRRSVEELSVDPQVRDWIRRQWRLVPMGVVSSSSVPDVIPILERQGIASMMDLVLCGDHVERLKPDPLPYLLAFKKLRAGFGIQDKRECLVFEDSATGIQSATTAGMTVHALEEPAELPGALEAWTERIAGARRRTSETGQA